MKKNSKKWIFVVIFLVIIISLIFLRKAPEEKGVGNMITVRLKTEDGQIIEHTPEELMAIVDGIPNIREIEFNVNAKNTGEFDFTEIFPSNSNYIQWLKYFDVTHVPLAQGASHTWTTGFVDAATIGKIWGYGCADLSMDITGRYLDDTNVAGELIKQGKIRMCISPLKEPNFEIRLSSSTGMEAIGVEGRIEPVLLEGGLIS